jgi:hypothetical protein
MALITNTITRYDYTLSVREDLSDVIYNISPVDVPFQSNIGRDKASQTFTEWQTDTLAAATTTNAQLEGDDLAKAANELKRDLEKIMTSLQVAVVGNNTVARKTAALGGWIITNYTPGTGTVAAAPVMSSGSDGYPATAAVAGTATVLTEARLKTAIQNVWTQGGSPDFVMTGPFNKTVISTFSGIATRFRDVPAGRQAQIIGAADVYVSDFGTVNIVPNRFQPETSVYLIDKSMAAVSYLRPYQSVPMAKTGDADKTLLIVEYALKIRNQRAFAHIADCTTA